MNQEIQDDKKGLIAFRYNIQGVVEEKAKEIIREQLKHFSIIDQISVLFLNF